jgi:FtsH-binding integral membrane protein
MRTMIVLRYLYVLALVAWLGGTLERIFDTRYIGASILGAVMLGTLIGMRVLGPKPVDFNLRIAIVLLMFVTAAYVALGTPGLSVLRSSASSASTIATTIVLVGGLSLLYWEARE